MDILEQKEINKNKTLKLFEYIKEISKSKEENFINSSNLLTPNLIELNSYLGVEVFPEDGTFLKIKRLSTNPSPKPEKQISMWFKKQKQETEKPEIKKEWIIKKEEIDNLEETCEKYHILEEIYGLKNIRKDYEFLTKKEKTVKFTQVENKIIHLIQKYLKDWEAWYSVEGKKAKTVNLYNLFFNKLQDLKNNGASDNSEIVIGMGWLKYKKEKINFDLPLIIQPCEIIMDDETHEIEVKSSLSNPSFNLNPLSECQFPLFNEIKQKLIQEQNKVNFLISPENFETYEKYLNVIAGLSSSGKILENQEKAEPESFSIFKDVKLFFRVRPNNRILNDIERFEKIILDGKEELPNIISELISSKKEINLKKEENNTLELFFPLPYNNEQIKIIEELELNDAVVVQGPPGTGKSHTISNIISHYLAKGKRVLVSSHSGDALQVIQEKIPDEIKPLCVSLISSDSESLKNFEKSIIEIQEKIYTFNNLKVEQKINEKNKKIKSNNEEILKIENEMFNLAFHYDEMNKNQFDISQQRKRKKEIENEFSYFEKKSGANFNEWPNFYEMEKFREELIKEKENIFLSENPYLIEKKEIKNIDFINYLNLKREEATIKEEKVEKPDFEEIEKLEKTKNFLIQKTSELKNKENAIKGNFFYNDWVELFDCLKNSKEKKEILNFIKETNKIITENEDKLKNINIPTSVFKEEKFVKFIKNKTLVNNYNFLEYTQIIFDSYLKSCINAVTINNNRPFSSDDWANLKKQISILKTIEKIKLNWNGFLKKNKLAKKWKDKDSLTKEILEQKELFLWMEGFLIWELITKKEHINEIYQFLSFSKMEIDKNEKEEEILIDLETKIKEINFLISENQKKLDYYQEFKEKERKINSDKIKLFFIEEYLNDREYSIIEPEFFYEKEKSYELIKEYNNLKSQFIFEATKNNYQNFETWVYEWLEKRNSFIEKNKKNKNSNDKTKIKEKIKEKIFKVNCEKTNHLFKNIEINYQEILSLTEKKYFELYNEYNIINKNIKNIVSETIFQEKYEKKKNIVKNNSLIYSEIAAEYAWKNLILSCPPTIKQALNKYVLSIKKIGNGTSKRSQRYLKEAREAMEEAYLAVPCWIMPEGRVCESMPSKMGVFDLVVIDEASQSDIKALTSIIRGKKVLIVGDDKQVSPSAVGISEEKIMYYQNEYLKEIENKNYFGQDKSIYELFLISFSNNHIMLKEHFRCDPDIISFSNKNYYNEKIIPLKPPTNNSPLNDFYVKGSKLIKDVNKIEAKALVENIQNIIDKEKNKDKPSSIGVVTLISNEKQAIFIKEEIVKKIDYNNIRKHNITVGTPKEFQGKEKDIIYISTTFDSNSRVSNREDMQQRFNVALSRAKNKMILFRSISDSQLKPNTLISSVIEHFKYLNSNSSNIKIKNETTLETKENLKNYLKENKINYKENYNITEDFTIDILILGSNGNKIAIVVYNDINDYKDKIKKQEILDRAGWNIFSIIEKEDVFYREQIYNLLEEKIKFLEIKSDDFLEKNRTHKYEEIDGSKFYTELDDDEYEIVKSNDINDFYLSIDEKKMLCDSDFEKEIVDFLEKEQFLFTVQYKVDNYKIDIVVKNEENNLKIAIELDGDSYHNLKNFDEDAERQNYIEKKLNIEFLRVRYSDYSLNKKETLKKIKETLLNKNIKPLKEID